MKRAASLSCLALHRMGVTWPPRLPAAPVVSYTTLSPLRLRADCLSVALLQNFTALQVLPGILPFGVRTFLTPHGARGPGWPELSHIKGRV